MNGVFLLGAMIAGAWIAVPDAPVATDADRKAQTSAPGTSWFVSTVKNGGEVVSAKWTTTALGIYELYLNGRPVGSDDALKPGFTHVKKTRRSFTYDVTAAFKRAKGAENVLAAEVSSGWWRDQIVGFAGKKSAFCGDLELTYADGTKATFGTDADHWSCAVAGPVLRAGIFDGEIYDARAAVPVFGGANFKKPEISTEFAGEILPSAGAEVCRRSDIALSPVEAYDWKGVSGASADAFGTVVKTRTFDPNGTLSVEPGETLVVDFGQNCAAVPSFSFSARPGVKLTCLPGEMLNDGTGEKSRGNDGPAGSLYRLNLRRPQTCMRLEYTFATDAVVTYLPRYTFFGYRYLSITADGPVKIVSLTSVPVTSIRKSMELGSIETGDKSLNRLIANVYWGQLSNYLSVPTDCPQRNERLGWAADTQVFCEAGSFNADTRAFLRKWMRDMCDTQDSRGGFPGVAPFAQYGNTPMRIGWADAGVIVPYQVWKQFGDTKIVEENWAAMEKYVARVAETRYEHGAVADECLNYQWADWLSFEKFESAGGAGKPQNSAFTFGPDGKGRQPKADALVYWDFLGGAYWTWDAQMMATMAKAIGKDAPKYEKMAADAKAYMIGRFFSTSDGMVLPVFRDMQTPALFALKLGFVEGRAREMTMAALRRNVRNNEGCLQTGFLGTSILMDTLTENGMIDLAYSVLLNRNCPGWLYSVDQGATTIWERWNSYTKAKGFGPVGMNSFNHYAYGAVLAWVYKTVAGIAADPANPGFKMIVMSPQPDRRLGFVKAEYKSAAGLVKSAWRYEGKKWIWEFTVPSGAMASVTVPGETVAKEYPAGSHRIEKDL